MHGTDSYLPLVHEVQLVHCVSEVEVHCPERYLPVVHELHHVHCVSLDREYLTRQGEGVRWLRGHREGGDSPRLTLATNSLGALSPAAVA